MFLFEDEYKALVNKKTIKEKSDYFYSMWTLKESYIKAYGKGTNMELNSFKISFQNNEIVLKDRHKENWLLKQYLLDENYVLAICSLEDKITDKINIYTCHEIYKAFEYSKEVYMEM